MSRTKVQKAKAKKLLKKPKGCLKPIDLENSNRPEWMTGAYSNNRYVIMIEDKVLMSNGEKAKKVMIQRHDDKPIPNHWKELQNIKNELFGNEKMAIEYYPRESQLVDKANIYWMWVFPDDVIPEPI